MAVSLDRDHGSVDAEQSGFLYPAPTDIALGHHDENRARGYVHGVGDDSYVLSPPGRCSPFGCDSGGRLRGVPGLYPTRAFGVEQWR